MEEIKIRYTWKRKEDGHIYQDIAPIACLEGKGDMPFVLNDNSLYDLIARDLFTGMKDKNKQDVFENDIVKRTGHYYRVVYSSGGFQLFKLLGDIEIDFELMGLHRGKYLAFYSSDLEVIGHAYEKVEGLKYLDRVNAN